ncbi:MAG: 50S ribosomal protein L23 [Patescibacteria group bacterium]
MALFGKPRRPEGSGLRPKASEPRRPEGSGLRPKASEENKKEEIISTKSPKEKKVGLAWSILKKAHVTEKAADLAAKNQYIFNVYPKTNKKQIKKSVEDIYGVDVISVNTINIPAKKRRLGRSKGWKSGYKKAIVKIKAGQEIELMPR